MKVKTKLGLLGATFLTAVTFGVATPAFAQHEPTTAAAAEEEEIVVTGSRLRRDPASVGTPLIQVQREDVMNSGEANVVDYLADIPALSASIVPEDTVGAGLGDGGLSLLNLRNLGTDRTLVLVDGRRHVGSGQGSPNVDIDTIPRLLIDNVEVITGGASAIYGADAVAGVVNFILRPDFEGVEVDAVYAEINQDHQANRRISALWGTSGANDRLNVYATMEYEQSDEVLDSDIDWQRRGCTLLNDDSDVNSATPDGDLDNKLICDAVSISRPYGSILTIAHDTPGTPANDPDILLSLCSTTSITSGNCFAIDPPFSFLFAPGGAPVVPNYGTFRDHNGLLRTTLVGGSGDPLTSFQDSRLPEADAFRFQAGFSYDINPGLELFSEFKTIQEHALDNFQPAFFDIQMRNGQNSPSFGALNQFAMHLDNAFLDPALLAQIQGNMRQRYGPPGFDSAELNPLCNGTTLPGATFDPNQPAQPCGAPIADPRAQVRLFTADLGARPQDNERNMTRVVLGLRGEQDSFLGLANMAWEAGYTYGTVQDENVESETIDAVRFAFSVDAVVDTLGLVNGIPNEIVCRSQLLTAQGLPVNVGGVGVIPGTDPSITECVPSSLFGPGGLLPAYDYIVTSQTTTNHDEQHDFLAFMTGDLPDVFGAGPLGLLLGYEWREESFSGRFITDPNGILLFANLLADFPSASFNVHELFAELRVPLLKDLPLAENVEFTASYRLSDYSNTDRTDTWGVQGSWRVIEDLMFRGTYGVSVRAPSLGNLYSPLGQTFLQVNDPCSQPIIIATTDPVIKQNRIDNCEAIWGSGIVGYVDPNPTFTNSGFSGGNPGLSPEEATSWTGSIVMTPRFIPNLSVIVDYWTIDVDNVIASLTLQQLVNGCTDGDTPNIPFCNLITRDAATFEIIDFRQVPVNFANFNARGVDVRVDYGFDLADVIGRDWGSIDFSLSGQWLIQRDNALNPLNTSDITELDSTANNPHGRFSTRTTWSLDRLALTWEVDYQAAQEIIDEDIAALDPDLRPANTLDTGDFIQHDFVAAFDINDNATIRAGVINAFDEEPEAWVGATDNFDLFGRRLFIGVNIRH